MKISSLIVVILMVPIMPAFAGEIDWSVANGFQLFKSDDDFQKLKEAWSKGDSAETFLSHQSSESLKNLLPIYDTWWQPDKGLYDKAGLFKPTHKVLLTYKGAPSGAQCTWNFNGKPVSTTRPCGDNAEVPDVQELTPFDLSVSVDKGPTEFLTGQEIRTKLILAVGDSFASGEGNPDDAAVTSKEELPLDKTLWIFDPHMGDGLLKADAQWWDVTCHRSLLSWPSLYAMKQAVSDPKLVVRFASFACSGSEIYNGFFRAQLKPPGVGAASRVASSQNRDGGNTTRLLAEKEDDTISSTMRISKRQLNKSQLNASIDLLCMGETKPGLSKTFRDQHKGLRKQPYYGAFKYDQCVGQVRHPDQLLSAFGGNDFGFSGVVEWGLFPKTVSGVSDKIKNIGFDVFRELVSPVNPRRAGIMAKKNIGLMYQDLAWAFENLLMVNPKEVYELVYPNPLPKDFSVLCSDRIQVGNTALTELFVEKTKLIPDLKKHASKFIFRIEPTDAKIIQDQFIIPLQKSQRTSIAQVRWTALEAQEGFTAVNGMRSMCGVAPDCESGSCDIADLSGWVKDPSLTDPSTQPIANISEWESYAPKRMRGLRTANDAVLTQASFDSNGKLRGDWLNGSEHPVAMVHAGIADSIDKIK